MSELDEFFESQDRFAGLSPNEQILRLGWFIHRNRNQDRFSPREISDQFKELHLSPPATSVYLPRLADRKPAPLLWDKRGYYLEGRERRRLDDLLAPSKTTAAVSKLLAGLVDQVPEGPKRVFLDEAIRCYRVSAFRAAIVMTWNLAYDHLRDWVIGDTDRLARFNEGSQKRFTKSAKTVVVKVADFDDYKESEFIDACASGKVFSKNLEVLLREKLRRRNMAAHPSTVSIQQPQADDVISDLVRNVLVGL